MRERQFFASLTRFAIGALLVTLAGTGFAVWTGINLERDIDTSPDAVVVDPQDAVSSMAKTYWLSPNTNNTLGFIPITVALEGAPEAKLQSAFEQLLSQANDSQLSAIPAGTELLGLEVTPMGIKVNLSEEFTTGGGSSSMIARLGQVLYTATSLQPDQGLWLSVEGEPLTLLGGEGLMIPQPLTRKEFTQQLGGVE